MILTKHDFFFNGFNFSDVLEVQEIRRPLIHVNNSSIHGKNRIFVHGINVEPQTIEIDVRIKAKDRYNLENFKKKILKHLYTEEPKKLMTRDSDLYDIAILDGEIDFEKFWWYGKTTLKFQSVFGYRFGKEIKVTLKNRDTIIPNGTAKTRAVFSTKILSSVGWVKITNQKTGEFVKITYPFSIGDKVIIDCDKELVTVNGSNILKNVELESDFFDLLPDKKNKITLDGLSQVEAVYTERWL